MVERAVIEAGIYRCLGPIIETAMDHPIAGSVGTAATLMSITAVANAAISGVEIISNYPSLSTVIMTSVPIAALGAIVVGTDGYLQWKSCQRMQAIFSHHEISGEDRLEVQNLLNTFANEPPTPPRRCLTPITQALKDYPIACCFSAAVAAATAVGFATIAGMKPIQNHPYVFAAISGSIVTGAGCISWGISQMLREKPVNQFARRMSAEAAAIIRARRIDMLLEPLDHQADEAKMSHGG